MLFVMASSYSVGTKPHLCCTLAHGHTEVTHLAIFVHSHTNPILETEIKIHSPCGSVGRDEKVPKYRTMGGKKLSCVCVTV